jgi:hypothetical protein
MTIEPVYHTLGKKIEPTVRTSFVLDGSCQTCAQLAKGEMCPPHDASPRCESGKRNHCSCDICF